MKVLLATKSHTHKPQSQARAASKQRKKPARLKLNSSVLGPYRSETHINTIITIKQWPC